MSDRRVSRAVETGKTILILLLICSAVYLFGRTQIYANLAAGGWLQSALGFFTGGVDQPSGPSWTQAEGLPVSLARPVRVASRGVEAEGRWGAQYGAESDLFFEETGGLLAEALAAASAPRTVSARTFQEALSRPSLYYDFLGRIPLDSLCLWLAHAANPALDDFAVRRVCLALTGTGGAALYFIREDDGLCYTSELPPDLAARLGDAASLRRANGALFAFEAGAAFDRVLPYVLLLPAPPRPLCYTARAPLGQLSPGGLSATAEQLLRALGFNPRLAGVYLVTDGVVVREGSDTLRISSDGVVTYRAPEGGESRYPAVSPLDAAACLAEATAGALAGGARLYLMEAREEEGRTVARFGYCLDGAQVTLPDGAAAAELVMDDGAIVEFTLVLRLFEPTADSALLMPELQAVAAVRALGASGGELLLRYEDTGGGLYSPVWGVR